MANGLRSRMILLKYVARDTWRVSAKYRTRSHGWMVNSQTIEPGSRRTGIHDG